MHRMHRLVLLVAVLITACQSVPEPTPAPPPEPLYSPFVVQVASSPFDVISFKDVGMSLPEEDRALTYESLAEGVALELSDERSSLVSYDERAASPDAHLACEGRHIYVDLWSNDERLGYSLWSGCGEDDRFALEELTRPGTPERDVDELSRAIASSLDRAVATGCFTRRC